MQQVIQLSKVAIDGGTQPRCEINDDLVSEYAQAMRAGESFPPIVVFEDGVKFWLADGFHRTHAARQAGLEVLDADVRQGTRRDAILFSVGANAAHGQRRTNADKRKAVMTLLEDAEWCTWPQTKIADACAVSQGFVSKVAAELGPDASYNKNKTRTVERGGKVFDQDTSNIGKHGTTATMNTANIGKRADPPSEPTSEPTPDPEPKPEPPRYESRGDALRIAHEAIKILYTISRNDGLRDEAFDTVINWIESNR